MEKENLVFVCIHVFERSRPVLLVTRSNDDWCFLCGAVHPDNPDQYKAIGMNHVLENDSSLLDVVDRLEPNQEAERIAESSDWLVTGVASS
jgi:hypothetical protein